MLVSTGAVCNAVDHQIVRHGLKMGHRDGITEDILSPGNRRSGGYGHIARHQPKIVALSGMEHQTVRPEAHQLAVTIRRSVMDLELDQLKLLNR
jgi:hypothetical protein